MSGSIIEVVDTSQVNSVTDSTPCFDNRQFSGYGGDPANSITDRLRLEVGDTDINDEGLTDSVYQYVLIKNGDDLTGDISPQSIIQSLKYLCAKYANFEHEEAGDLEIWGDKYDQYRQLLDSHLKDPRYGSAIPLPFAGGISKSDIKLNFDNPDANRMTIHENWFKRNNNPSNDPLDWRRSNG